MTEKKVKRPVEDIIKEKIGWLEKRIRDENNDRLTRFPSADDRMESNNRFGQVVDDLNSVKRYLLGDPPPVKEPTDD